MGLCDSALTLEEHLLHAENWSPQHHMMMDEHAFYCAMRQQTLLSELLADM